MTRIFVDRLIGSICIDPVDGLILGDQILAELDLHDCVELDFSSVTTLVSPFLHATVSRLFPDASNALTSRVQWVGLDQIEHNLVELVLQKAARFYTASTEQQGALLESSHRSFDR